MMPKVVDWNWVYWHGIFQDPPVEEHLKNIAFAKVWNTIINYFYDIHKVSKEELQV